MLQATTPALRQSQGKIVFVSSGAATGDTQGWAAYNSTKVRFTGILLLKFAV
jgi:NAD(P)-dependent dehydrogenase (short-subunit alcohol dehydrogenase family)